MAIQAARIELQRAAQVESALDPATPAQQRLSEQGPGQGPRRIELRGLGERGLGAHGAVTGLLPLRGVQLAQAQVEHGGRGKSRERFGEDALRLNELPIGQKLIHLAGCVAGVPLDGNSGPVSALDTGGAEPRLEHRADRFLERSRRGVGPLRACG